MLRPAIPDALLLPPRPSGVATGRWIADAVRQQIADGQLRSGSRLPSSRRLAVQLGVARGTVVMAIEQLQAEGYVEGRPGFGVVVSVDVPGGALARRGRASPATARLRPRTLSAQASRLTAFPRFDAARPRAFRSHLPALDLFPVDVWARVSHRRLRAATSRMLVGAGPMGYDPLRLALADYLQRSRGVRCDPSQIAIVSGVQDALDCLGRLLIDPGDRVCVEDPGYPGARHALTLAGATIVSVPVDGDGMQVPSTRSARLAYVTPAHQSPLGITMSLARRLDLLAWARRAGAVIVEDDYDSEYRYAGRPLPSLQGLDRHGVVAFTGSFSKTMYPALRIGFLVAPAALVERLEALLSVCGPHVPLFDQAVLCHFIVEGHLFRHLRRMRQIYARRLSALHDAVRARLGGRLALSPIEAGLQTVGLLDDGIASEAVARAAEVAGVEVTPLLRYAREMPAPEGLLLGFACVDEPAIRKGIETLAHVFDDLDRKRRRSR